MEIRRFNIINQLRTFNPVAADYYAERTANCPGHFYSIGSFCMWATTPQGWAFWNEVNDELMRRFG